MISDMIDKFVDWVTSYNWHMETTLISMVLFGEYPYPAKEDYE